SGEDEAAFSVLSNLFSSSEPQYPKNEAFAGLSNWGTFACVEVNDISNTSMIVFGILISLDEKQLHYSLA
ncbi:MAG: hypothetical protein E7E23_04055, partial [Paenibacillus sp.]|uniref:hypothetical protein n=1 Tax=Paenibacillus sp. TaxID=58172 RepID=UPI00290325DC